MKLYCFAEKDKWYVDPPVHSMLQELPREVMADSPQTADVTIVPITFFDWFRFDEGALSQLIGKRWVLMDYTEHGWDWDQQASYIWGNGMLNHPRFGADTETNHSYRRFDEWVRHNPPILTFQRELLAKDRTERRIPIEYTNRLPEFGNDTKTHFLARPFEAAYNWSRSHEDRPWLHGTIFIGATNHGYEVVTDFSHVDQAIKENPNTKKWLSVHTPHYSRIEVRDVQKFMRMSKVAISMPGCGVKCFRHGEVCMDSIMAIQKNELAWSYPWDASNSISFTYPSAAVDIISKRLAQDDAYDLYVAAIENGRNYRCDTYLRRWVIGNIQKAL